MLDRKACKKMLVWDEWYEKQERIVIDVDNLGICTAVLKNYEEAFLRGDFYRTIIYDHCEEIKEPEWVPFTENCQLEPYLDCWFRLKSDTITSRVTSFQKIGDPLYLGGLWRTRNELFESWEVKVDGKWQPVGELKNEIC